MSNGIKWNDEQNKIINFREGNMVVAASAGSGKTTVMLERVMKIIEEGTPIDRIVILAFNKSIASEIRGKLYKKILAKIESDDSENVEFLCEQLDNIAYANIITNDSYCNKTVREFFHVLGINPEMDIMGEKEEKMLIRKCFEMAVDNFISSDISWIFDLTTKLGGREKLFDEVKRINNFAIASPDSEEWIALAGDEQNSDGVDGSIAMTYFKRMLIERCGFAVSRLERAKSQVEEYSEKHANDYQVKMDFFAKVQGLEKYQDIYSVVRSFTYAKKPNKNAKIVIDWDEQERCHSDAKDVYSWLCDMVVENYEHASKVYASTTSDINKLISVYKETLRLYTDEKYKTNRFTHSDFMQNTLKLLADDDIRTEISARYDYIAIDEFQDTNYAQESMFQCISNGNNLFMVGDSKQSIYGFRLSEPEIMLGKYRDYKSGKSVGSTVHLDNNYRSDKRVLDFVNMIFNNIMHETFGGVDYESTDQLIAGAEYKDTGNIKPYNIDLFVKDKEDKETLCLTDEVYSVERDRVGRDKMAKGVQEGKFIADKIHQLVATGTIFDTELGHERKVEYRDIAILARSKGGCVPEILRIVQEEGIPTDISSLVKSADVHEVEIIKEILKLISNDMQDLPLSAVLNSYWIGMEMDEQFEIRHKHKDEKFFHNACLLEKENYVKLRKLYDMIARLRLLASYMSVVEVVTEIVYGYGYDKYLLSDKSGGYKLSTVQVFISSLSTLGAGITVTEYVQSDAGDDFKIEGMGKGNIVSAMTVHKSKGLEFPIVFVCDLAHTSGGGGFSIPKVQLDTSMGIAINYFDDKNMYALDNFVFRALSEKHKFDEMNESMRILYVALTRAKNALFLTGTVASDSTKYKSPYKINSFIDWIYNTALTDYRVLNCINFHDTESVKTNIMERYTFRATKCEPIAEIDKYLDFVYPYEENTKTSIKYTVTEINKIDSYEDGLEQDTNNNTDYEQKVVDKSKRGTNYHAILENISYDITGIDQVKAELYAMSEQGLISSSELEEINADEILRVVTSDLMKYASANKHYREREFMLSVMASDVMDTSVHDKILVQGAVDLIIDGEKLIVVDFKKSNQPDNVLRERYRKQLELYSLAVSEALGRSVDHSVIYVIGRDEIIEF